MSESDDVSRVILVQQVPYSELTDDQLAAGLHDALDLIMFRGTSLGFKGSEQVNVSTTNEVIQWLHDALCPDGLAARKPVLDQAADQERIKQLEERVTALMRAFADFYACEVCNKPRRGLNGPKAMPHPVIYHRASYEGVHK